MPSLNQIKEGIKAEGRAQMKLAMGNVKDQKLVLQAMKEQDETWDEFFQLAQVKDPDAPLETLDNNFKPYPGGLRDPTSSIVAHITYLFQ